MTTQVQKELEKKYFDYFRSIYDLPHGEIDFDREKPDFLIKGKKTIGIEITNLYHDSDEQNQMAIRHDLVTKTKEMYKKKHHKKIELALSFNPAFPIKKFQKTSKRFLKTVEDITDQSNGQIDSELFKDFPELSKLWFFGEIKNSQWRIFRSYEGKLLDKKKLEQAVSKKENRAKNYLPCDENWLLLVIDFWNGAQDQEISKANIDHLQSNFFHKIIIFKTVEDQFLEWNKKV